MNNIEVRGEGLGIKALLLVCDEKRWAVLCWRNRIRQTKQLVLPYTRHDLGFWCLGNVVGGGIRHMI